MENKGGLAHMANQTETIRKFVSYLNNPDEQGGFWLPNIQRLFVWKEEG
jgi:hypothetical protein